MSIADLQRAAHQNAKDKGFWDGKDPVTSLPEAIALIHSELSEALEEYRNPTVDVRGVYFGQERVDLGSRETVLALGAGRKPEGVVIEFADAVIRIMDNCEALGLDLGAAIRLKMAYNATRPHRHGGKRA